MPTSTAGAASRRRRLRRGASATAPNQISAEDPRVVAPSPDAATVAAVLQLQMERREKLCSLLALGVKFGLVTVGAISLVTLSFAYQERLERHGELAAVVDVETGKLRNLQQRFDRLFTLGGDRRLMDEQDQWIAPNRLRVIWR